MRKVKWGVIGTASIAKSCTITGMKMAENCELVAIAGRDIKKAESYKEEFGFEIAYGSYDELIANPDIEAVYIPLPNDLHYEWCMKAIKAGKNVLCEKPLAPDKETANKLFNAAKEAGVVLMEAFAYQHSPYVAALKEELDSKVIGDIKYLESAFFIQELAPDNIRMFRKNYGGAMYDLGCYCVSMFTRLLDKLPVSAQGLGEFTDEHIDLFSTAYLSYDDGIRASLSCGMIFDSAKDSRMDRLYIHGTNGYIRSNVEYNQCGDLTYTVCVDGKEEIKTVKVDHNYKMEVEQLGRCITDGEAPFVSPEFSIMNAEAMDIVLKAIGY